jgi:hypothetical protein
VSEEYASATGKYIIVKKPYAFYREDEMLLLINLLDKKDKEGFDFCDSDLDNGILIFKRRDS